MSHNIRTQFDAYVRAAMLLARYEYDHTDDPAAHIDCFEEMLKTTQSGRSARCSPARRNTRRGKKVTCRAEQVTIPQIKKAGVYR